MKTRFLLWLVYWGKLVDGLVGVLSLGFINTDLGLYAVKNYAKYTFNKKGYDL